jgi:hypothetical protein
MNNAKKAKKEPVEKFFSEGARWMGLSANESRGLALHDAYVKSKNRRLVMELAGNLCEYDLGQHEFSEFPQIRLKISTKQLHEHTCHL